MPGGVDDPSIAGPGRLDGLNYRFSYPQHAIVFHHGPLSRQVQYFGRVSVRPVALTTVGDTAG